MKDITHYFPSPNKVGSSPESAISPNSQRALSGSSPKNKNGAKKSASPRIKQKRTPRKRKRKPTDPEVRKVMELFSNKLNFTSPNTTPTEVQTLDAETQILQLEIDNGESSNSTVDHDISPPVPDDNESNNVESDEVLSAPSTPIVNAFQFLMESRNNIIGSNSCASSKSESESTSVIDKSKLKARRRLLEDWADKQGAVKRKRDEHEIDSCISLKLEKRAKRLKNMLRADELKVQEENKSDNSIINSSLCRSESESSNDLTLQENISKSLNNATELSDDKSPNSSTSNSPSPNKRPKENGQKSLLNFIEIVSKEHSSSDLKNFDKSPKSDAKQVIKIKMFTPSFSSPRNGSSSTSGSSPDEVKSKTPRRKKHIGGSSQRPKRYCKSSHGIVKSNKQSPKYRKSSTRTNSNSDQLNSTRANSLTSNQPQLESVNEDETAVVEAGSSRESVVSPILEKRSLRIRRKVDYKETKIELPTSVNKPKRQSSKKSRNTKAGNSMENIELLSDSDNEENNKRKVKIPIKLAPVFLKSTPKPKLDAETIQARKQFLLSGIPDSLKKTVEKQKSVDEKDYNIFPVVSHVQQKCESKLWNLPFCDFPQVPNNPLQIDRGNLKCSDLIIKELPYEIQLTTSVDKITNVKSVIQKMKADNPDYPVFKVFRQLYERSGKHFLDEKKAPRKQSKKCNRKSQEIACEEDASKKYELWMDKYKPRVPEEILSNHHGAVKLRNWLEIWKNYSQEINSKKRKRAFNSESEFESTDCDSRDSTYLPGNTVILHGPCGCGKTSAVYAVANEFNFNVLELNASTRRTGKILLQELKEATRSHQVRKHESSVMESTNQQKSTKSKAKKCQTQEPETRNHQKMCILLLEDIDLLFDQDEGFLSSLSHLIMTSKRPIILTTTDKSPPHVQKFMNHYECISFTPLSPRCLAVWLQILCLIEGLLTDRDELGNLLEYNTGDIRKTLLELQFWAQSGGQLERSKEYPLKAGGSCKNILKIRDEDCSVEQTDKPEDFPEQKQFIHRHCLGSFEIFRVNKEYFIPQNMDLGNIWWNIPNILDVPSCSSSRTEKRAIEIECADPDPKDKQKIKSLSGLYDYLSLSDSLLTTVNGHGSNEPVVNSRSVEVLNSLELTERKEDGNAVFAELFQDMCHTLVNESIENYKQTYMTRPTLNMGMPDANERRWRANLHLCEDFLKQPIPLSNVLNRKSAALDYLPSLRHIARSEQTRAATNTKRGNRFRHYLKGLNMQFKASTCELACNCLNME